MVEHIKRIKAAKLKRFLRTAWGMLVSIVTYFSAQRRFDRKLMKRALDPKTIEKSRKQVEDYWKAKRESGRVSIQHGGTITTEKPFPPRGSLLTEEERNDPMFRGG